MTRRDPAPVVTPADAGRIAARARAEGRAVVLANGCFDILHVGHVRYLGAARRQGDFLVVGVNDDASVLAAKGEGRPLLPARARARVVAAIEAVDLVTVFTETTADRLIETVRPAVHCKGTDYADGVPEQETVAEVGGRVAIVGDPKEHGTRELIDAIRRGPR